MPLRGPHPVHNLDGNRGARGMAATQEQAAWVGRVLGVAAAAPAGAAAGKGLEQALAGWQAARATALASLKQLEGAFRGMEHPARDQAIILLKAVQANLTAAPTSAAQVKELARYLTTDDVITEAEIPNGFGITVSLREPLMQALAGLYREVNAVGTP